MDFKILINKDIINVLIGDVNVFGNFSMPYMKGPDLCDLCTKFGLHKTYNWGDGVNSSRWIYMQELLEYLNKQNRVGELLSYLMDISRFSILNSRVDANEVKDTYEAIIDGTIKTINAHLLMARKELRIVHDQFVIATIGEELSFDAPKVKIVTNQYIRELPFRINYDLTNKDYDSVITKSRTLLEEVLIYIIEKKTSECYKSKGDLVRIYQDATDLLNMRQKEEWDKRINELLGALHKLVNAISSMRNMNSDAHGAGQRRITIKKREALLVAHSSMILAEYCLSVFENKE